MIYYLFFSGHGLTNKQLEQTSVIQFGIIYSYSILSQEINTQNQKLVATLGARISDCI